VGLVLPSAGPGTTLAQGTCACAAALRHCAPSNDGLRRACGALCKRRRAASQRGKKAPARGRAGLCDCGDNSWPLRSNGACTVALKKRLDHMK
jgi:hypothetical protein